MDSAVIPASAGETPQEQKAADRVIMRVWLWDAGNYLGVTDDEERARAAAARCIRSGGTARVELARLVTVSADGLQHSYQRSGVGQAGQRAGSLVTWTPLRREAAMA